MKNKKGLSFFVALIIGFGVVATVFMFLSLLVYDTGKDYVIDISADVGRDVLANYTELPAYQGVDTIDQIQQDYDDFLIPYDIFFLLSFLVAFGSTVFISWQAQREGIFSFFGYIFIGSLLLLLITVFINDFNIWFQANLFDTVFADSNVSTPILDFYLSNMAIINLLWWLILVLVNNMDRNFISRSGEVQE